MAICTSIGEHWTTKDCCVILNLHVSVWMSGVGSSAALLLSRGLHGLKTEARTRPVPEIVWPDPTRAAQLHLEPEPDPEIPPPPTTNSQLKKKRKKAAFLDCMQRNRLIKALPFHKHLPVMKVCEHQVQRSHTFCRVYAFCLDKTIILPPCKLWSFFVS